MSDAAIVADGLRKAFGQVTALDGLSLRVAAGSVLGLLGPNGSGKTTTVSILSTALRPDGGRATVHGLDVVADAALVRRVIGFAGQFAAVDPNLTGRENLTLIGRLSRVGRKQAKIRAAELLFPRPERSPHGDPDHRRHRGAGMNTLDGQVALVTGSSRGIGAAIAAEFARRGAAVAVHGRDQAAAAAVAAGIARDGGKVITVIGDVTEFGHVESVRRQVEDGLGPVDILVANAGGSFTPPAPLEEIPEDGWRATVDGNLLATFLTMKSFLPGMKDRGRGVIITISSAAGRRPHPQSPIPYAAAKAGIALLTQDVAAQAGPFGIRVNCIAPETILTERNRERIPSESQATMADWHPLKRLGTPEDVANTAAFLASAEAAWLTGLVVDVAGGAVMV